MRREIKHNGKKTKRARARESESEEMEGTRGGKRQRGRDMVSRAD